MQPTPNRATRTFMDYESVPAAMDGTGFRVLRRLVFTDILCLSCGFDGYDFWIVVLGV